MKIVTTFLPSEDHASVVLIRFIPEQDSERQHVAEAREALRGTSAIVASPKIGEEKVLSLMFHAKTNQTTKA